MVSTGLFFFWKTDHFNNSFGSAGVISTFGSVLTIGHYMAHIFLPNEVTRLCRSEGTARLGIKLSMSVRCVFKPCNQAALSAHGNRWPRPTLNHRTTYLLVINHSTGNKLVKNAKKKIEKGRTRKGSGKLREAVNVIHVKDLVARYTWKEHFFPLSTPLQSTNLPQNLHGTVQIILQFKMSQFPE